MDALVNTIVWQDVFCADLLYSFSAVCYMVLWLIRLELLLSLVTKFSYIIQLELALVDRLLLACAVVYDLSGMQTCV